MGWEGDTAAELLMVAGLARDVPIAAKALEGTTVRLLSRAAHGQVHHNNSGHFRGNYQRVSLNNQFPSAPEIVLTGKGKKEEDSGCAGLGTKLPCRVAPWQTPSHFTK